MLAMPRKIIRLFQIQWTVIRYSLDEVIFDIPFLKPIHFFVRLLPWHWSKSKLPLAKRIVMSLEALGPVFIKFGQMLSTRRDLLPEDIADELAKLQDNVAPFSGSAARKIVEDALGAPVTGLFAEFDEEPLAAASVAQVHSAKLQDGREVVVKVLRPDAKKRIQRDIEALYLLAGMVRTMFGADRLRPVEVIAEFEKTILRELDLMHEAANAGQLRRNFADSEILYVPEVYWPYCRRNVLVIERIYGIPINDIESLHKSGTNMQTLAERGVQIFFTQVFEHNLFHADMHPGNLFVRVDDPENPVYAGVDFGIVGTLSERDKYYLAENFLAFFNYDYKRIARLHVESGWVSEDVREDELETAVRTLCEPLVNRPLNEISFGHLLIRLFRIGRQFNMEIQPQLILLQKTLLNIEGLGRDLYPSLDLWETAKPFLERWSYRRAGLKSIVDSFVENAPEALQYLPRMPQQAWRTLHTLARDSQSPDKRYQSLERTMRKMTRYVIYTVAAATVILALILFNI